MDIGVVLVGIVVWVWVSSVLVLSCGVVCGLMISWCGYSSGLICGWKLYSVFVIVRIMRNGIMNRLV